MPETPTVDTAEKQPTTVILFDWGDTLMVDYPDTLGKMCDWPTVTVVEGAEKTLQQLSENARLYVATGAADSSQEDIRSAFRRVGLDRYLTGYFCQNNVGVAKGTAEFLPRILQRLDVQCDQVTMVGDSFSKDIAPALAAGINAVWLSRDTNTNLATQRHPLLQRVTSLQQICPLLFPGK
ncbi:MAG: HAD family hydrolase [Motiliproteus sp.]